MQRELEIGKNILCAGAAVLCAFSIVFTIYWLPGSFRSSREYSVAKNILTSDPTQSFNLLMAAIKNFPFELDPRREAFKPLVNVMAIGGTTTQIIADDLYQISRQAAGNTPDLLFSRIYYYFNIGQAGEATHAAEIDSLLSTLRKINPRFADLEKIEFAVMGVRRNRE